MTNVEQVLLLAEMVALVRGAGKGSFRGGGGMRSAGRASVDRTLREMVTEWAADDFARREYPNIVLLRVRVDGGLREL